MRTLPRAVPLALLACLLVTGIAIADPVIPGTPPGVRAKFDDWTTLVTPAGVPVIGAPAPGDEGRTILNATTLYSHVIPLTTVGGTQIWDPLSAGEEITALVYNTFIPGPGFFGGVAGVSVMWEFQPLAAGYVNIGDDGIVFKPDGYVDRVYLINDNTPGAAPARFDIYVDGTPDYNPTAGPGAWVPGVGLAPDAYPTYSDGSLWLSGGFSPVIADFDSDLYRDPGEPNLAWWDVNGNGVFEPGMGDTWAIELVNSITPGRAGGYSNAWLDATGGSYINMVDQDHLDLAGSPWDYDLFFQSTAYGPSDNWPNTSTDPVLFAVVPEPVSMVFFGTIMVGAVASALRKRSK